MDNEHPRIALSKALMWLKRRMNDWPLVDDECILGETSAASAPALEKPPDHRVRKDGSMNRGRRNNGSAPVTRPVTTFTVEDCLDIQRIMEEVVSGKRPWVR